MKALLLNYSKRYHELMADPSLLESVKMPGDAYFIDGNTILSLPSETVDSRYPYGKNGFNYWTYTSGYIHCNEGLFSPFLRASEGAEPKIAFFAGLEDEKLFSLLSVPKVASEPEGITRYTLFTKSCTYYMTEYQNMIFGLRTFVDKTNHIYFSLEVINTTGEERVVKVSSYFNPFIKNSLMENGTDRWFRNASYIDNNPLGSFQIETYEEKDRSRMMTNYGILSRSIRDKDKLINIEITTSRYGYVGGIRSSLHTAKVLEMGVIEQEKQVTSFTETAICGDVMTLQVTDQLRIDMRFAFTFEAQKAEVLLEERISAFMIDYLLDEVAEEEARNESGIGLLAKEANRVAEDLGLKEQVYNGFMEHLKKQVEFCSVIKGYVQLSSFSLIGIRDVFQAIEGLLYWQPEVAKAKMLEALNFLSPKGRLPRQYALPAEENQAPAMDLRPFIDQGVWVISTIASYLKQTQDYDFLKRPCGYYEILDDHKHLVKKSQLTDSVLEHMIKIMDYLILNRDHDYTKCVLALYGDWNDALDGLGKSKKSGQEYGTGVSVMATLQVYQNLKEMIVLLSHLDSTSYATHILKYKAVLEEIRTGLYEHALVEDRILHGWGDEKSYLVGSHEDPDGISRDGLTSNAFWILSGLLRDGIEQEAINSIHSPERIRTNILKAYKRLESKYGMKTFEPAFDKGTEGVGRIPNLPKGTAENGATYIHASMFGVMSLFAIGESVKAWEEMAKLLPITHEHISVSPYVIPNSYGFNQDLGIDGESMADWQTGSSNVLLKTLIRYVYGYEPTWDGLLIQPSTHQPFNHLQLKIDYLGKELQLTYENKGIGVRRFYLNGELIQGDYDPVMKMERLHLRRQQLQGFSRISILVED